MIIGWLQSQLSSGNHFQKTSVTDRQTDRVQTYSPLRFHRWGTNKSMHNWQSTEPNKSFFWYVVKSQDSKIIKVKVYLKIQLNDMVADLCHFVFSLFRGDITKAP